MTPEARAREATHSALADLEYAVGEGLAEILHELKAPLHAAAGFLDLVAGEHVGPLNDQQKDFLETARGECARLKNTLDRLVEAGASPAERPGRLGRVEPADLVWASIDRVRGQAALLGVKLVGRVEEGAQPVQADRGAVLQVLGNLLQNALRVAPSGSQIVVRATTQPDATRFEVTDRGPGVAQDDLRAIFERFAQGSERAPQAGEVGLGLAISRRIVAQHQGRIWAENRPDGGARFCFALPTLELTAPAAAAATSRVRSRAVVSAT